MKPLEERPDEVVTLHDRAEIEAILLRCGLINKLFSSRELRGRIVAYYEHDTHWLLAARMRAASKDNFILYAFPKCRFSHAQFDQMRDELARRQAPTQSGSYETTDATDN